MKFFSQYSLKSRLTVFTLLIMLVSLWTFVYYVCRTVRLDIKNLASEQALASASLMANEINDQIEARLKVLSVISREVPPALLSNVPALQKQMEQRSSLMSYFNSGAFFVDAKGVVTAGVPVSAERRGLSHMDRDFVRAALKEGKAMVGKPVFGIQLDAPIFAMVVPIFDSKGKVTGALAGITNLAEPSFMDKVSQNSYGKSGSYMVVDKESRMIVAATDKKSVMTPVNPPGSLALVDQFVQGFEGSGIFTNNQGVEVLASAKSIPAANWYAAVNLPTKEAFAPIERMDQRLLIATLMLTLAAGFITRWILGWQLRPLDRASQYLVKQSLNAQALEPLPVERKDEIGNLIGAFNNLLASLADRELALSKSDEFTRMIADNITGLLAYYTLDMRCFFANDKHQLWFGLSPSDMEGRLLSDILTPEQMAFRKPYIEGVLAGQEQTFETTYYRIDGSEVYAMTQYIPRKVGGLVKGFFVLTTDITARHAAEMEAIAASNLIRGAIEAIDEAFVLYDAEDRLVFCNDKYKQIYSKVSDLMVPGRTFEELLRMDAQRGEFKDAIGREEEWVAERLAAHRAANADLVQRLENGRVLRIVERRMPDGQTVGFRIDITDLVKATEAAQAANQAKSQFLATMSHEIRTPMNAILGMLKLLQNSELDARQQDYTSKAEGAAKALLGLLNDILDFSKIDAGKMELDLQPFRLDRLLRDLSVIVSANVADKTLEVLYDIDPAVPRELLGDALRLQQILINLTSNAIKFTARGEVVVQIRMLEKSDQMCRLRFSVRDSGIGIAPEHQKRVFEGFSQAEASTTRRFGGTGLGLSISLRLVRLMGGELGLESELGRGSNFYFTLSLPVSAHESQAAAMRAQVELANLEVLVVDDNPVARELISGMTQSFGWKTDVAADGAQALYLMQARLQVKKPPYQVIFLDWDMPGLDGWQTLERIRKLELGGDPSITVMVTGHGRELLSSRSAKAQAMLNAFLVKPVTASMLFDAVSDARAGHSNVRARCRLPAGLKRHLEGLHLLLVEDNLVNQQLAQELLSQAGASVEIAENGQSAVQAIASAEKPFDAVLMDLQMPVMDGFEATRAIREELGLKDLPVIAMTANAMASDREACLAAGMNDHVGKPFDLPHLIEVLLGCTQRLGGKSGDTPLRDQPTPNQLESNNSQAGGSLYLIDAKTAIARMGGNADLYGRSLQAFQAELASQVKAITAMVSANELTQLGRVLHTLKGLSATLGADALAGKLKAAESVIKSGSSNNLQELICQVLIDLSTTMKVLQPVIEQYLPKVSAPAGPEISLTSPVQNLADLRQDLQALLRLLKSSDMAALEAFAYLRKRHPSVPQAPMEALDAAMANLDFEAAAQALLSLEQAI